MANIRAKVVRVKDPETGIWNDVPAVVSLESFRAAERAQASELAADEARAAAEAAQGLAEAAQGAAEDAKTGAETAKTGAENAESGAQAAQRAAEDAQGLAEDAQGAAEAAQAGAQAAGVAAVAAIQAAQGTAVGAVETAKETAVAAVGEAAETITEEVGQIETNKADIGDLKESTKSDYSKASKTYLFESGSIASADGQNPQTIDPKRIRTTYYLYNDVKIVNVNSDYSFLLAVYNELEEYLGMWTGSDIQKTATWLSGEVNLASLKNDTYKYRICVKRNDNTNISVNEASNVIFFENTDKTLTESGTSADAKVVGEIFDSMLFDIDVDYETQELLSYYINASKQWTIATGSDVSKSCVIPLEGVKKVKITGNSNGSIICFLNTFATPSHGATPDYSDPHFNRVLINDGVTMEFIVDKTMNFMYSLVSDSSGNDRTPVTVFYKNIDETLSQSMAAADASIVGNLFFGNKLRDKNTPHVMTYYPVTEDSLDLKTLPNDTWVYTTYGKISETFDGTNAPDLGLKTSSYVRIEKRSLSNNPNIYCLFIQPYPTKRGGLTAFMFKGTGYSWIVVPDKNYIDNAIEEVKGRSLGNTKEQLFYGLNKVNISGYEEEYVLVDNEGTVEPSDRTLLFTDYIKCDKYVAFNLKSTSARIIVYFYTKSDDNYTLTWDVLNLTSSQTTNYAKNRLGKNSFHNQVLEIPNYENTYMKIGVDAGSADDADIYLWDGEHIGPNLTSEWRIANPSTGVSTSDTSIHNMCGLILPGNPVLLLAKNMIIRHIFGVKNGTRTKLESFIYAQCYQLPIGYDYFKIDVYFAGENIREGEAVEGSYPHPELLLKTGAVDLANYLCAVMPSDCTSDTFGLAEKVKNNAKQLCRTEWTCKKQTTIYGSGNFYVNKNYLGIPYSSSWTKADFVGWHISLDTFANAANDEDSKFYNEHGRNGRGPGYGIVCSAFASLCMGNPYPVLTNCLIRDPQMEHEYTLQPKVGTIMYNNAGHCFLILEENKGQNYKMGILAEGVNPCCMYRNLFEFKNYEGNDFYHMGYINDYLYSCVHKKGNAILGGYCYDLSDATIVNGSARPYRGNKGVYTSDMDIKINIKDATAQTLYYSKCLYSNGIFTPIGTVMSKSIPYGATSVNIDKNTLEDGGFYGVYTDADNKMEYFEYHVITTETYRKTDDGNMVFSNNNFWYVLWWRDDIEENNQNIMFPKLESGDYREYLAVPDFEMGTAPGYMFFKGTLGAYVAPIVSAT